MPPQCARLVERRIRRYAEQPGANPFITRRTFDQTHECSLHDVGGTVRIPSQSQCVAKQAHRVLTIKLFYIHALKTLLAAPPSAAAAY